MVHDASADMIPRDVEYTVKVGSRKTVTLSLTDTCNVAVPMCCVCIYNSGSWKVFKPCGTIVFCGDIVYTTRASGLVSYTLGVCDAIAANKGSWAGEVEYINASCVISDHSQTFRFNINQSV